MQKSEKGGTGDQVGQQAGRHSQIIRVLSEEIAYFFSDLFLSVILP